MHHDDPDRMSIDDRLEELAALLAAGFLRLKRRTGIVPSPMSESADSSKTAPDSAWQSSKSPALCQPR
jgi:hypothetical protein